MPVTMPTIASAKPLANRLCWLKSPRRENKILPPQANNVVAKGDYEAIRRLRISTRSAFF